MFALCTTGPVQRGTIFERHKFLLRRSMGLKLPMLYHHSTSFVPCPRCVLEAQSSVERSPNATVSVVAFNGTQVNYALPPLHLVRSMFALDTRSPAPRGTIVERYGFCYGCSRHGTQVPACPVRWLSTDPMPQGRKRLTIYHYNSCPNSLRSVDSSRSGSAIRRSSNIILGQCVQIHMHPVKPCYEQI
jgi:hypothetical protein